MNCDENCRFCHKMLNADNSRVYGPYYCKFWQEMTYVGKPCRDYLPKEEDPE